MNSIDIMECCTPVHLSNHNHMVITLFHYPDWVFLTRVTKIFLDKNSQKICQSHLNTLSRERLLTFLINFLFLKILAFFAQKTEILAKK